MYASVHLVVGRRSRIDKMKNDLLMRRTYNSIILILNESRKKNSDRYTYTHTRINIYQDFGWQRKSLSSSHLCSVAACTSIIFICLFEQQYLLLFLTRTIKRTLRNKTNQIESFVVVFSFMKIYFYWKVYRDFEIWKKKNER